MNKDEIKKAIAEGDDDLHKAILGAIKETETGKSYTSTVAKNYFEENIGQEHKKIYGFVDNALTDAGFEKPSNVKTSEWVSMIAKQNKELTDKLESLKGSGNADEIAKKMDELRSKHKKEKNELTANYQKEITDAKTKIQDLTQAQVTSAKKTEISSAISGLEFNKGLDKSLLNDIVSVKTQKLIQNSKLEDGKIVWCKEDGTPYKDGILNASLENILKSELSSVLHTSTAGGNAGTADSNAGTFDGSAVHIPAESFTTQEQFVTEFNKICQKKGIPAGEQKEKLYWEAFERYNISSLKEY